MVTYTKRQLIDHIHLLLAVQIRMAGEINGRCVLRDDRIELIPFDCTRATDLVIIDYVKSPDTVPLRTVIHQGVEEHWDALRTVNLIATDVLAQRPRTAR